MPAYKDKNGTWYAMVRYTDWRGEKKQKCQRGFETRRDALVWEAQFKLEMRAIQDELRRIADGQTASEDLLTRIDLIFSVMAGMQTEDISL